MTDKSTTEETVHVVNPYGKGDVVLVCEHASNAIPANFNSLGLSDTAQTAHIAWDPGAYDVALALSALLDAPLVASRVSRLVYDCNRPPEAPSAMPVRSDTYDIPGNQMLSEADKSWRISNVYLPFHESVASLLDRRKSESRHSVLITIHTFTPIYAGVQRDVELGILHDADSRFADLMLLESNSQPGFNTQRNQPYGPEDGVTHTLQKHTAHRAMLNVMIEIRNDLVTNADAVETCATILSGLITSSLLHCKDHMDSESIKERH